MLFWVAKRRKKLWTIYWTDFNNHFCKMRKLITLLTTLILMDFAFAGEESPKYRTDENNDNSLPWYQPKMGVFPPEDASHNVSGDLFGGNRIERELFIRVDRNDTQGRALWDYPLKANMLPYGSVYYLGQYAALTDIPLGTHLHGWFFDRPEGEERHWNTTRHGKPQNKYGVRASPEVDFTQCLRVEDDFSYHQRRNEAWKVVSVDLEAMEMEAILLKDGKESGKPKKYHLRSSSIVYKGKGFGTLKSIQPGQVVQMNLTWVTLYGPGRVFQIWLDEESRKLASEQQLKRHRDYIKERGIPGWVDAIDDKNKHVTISFFDGIDTSLFKDFDIIVPEPLGWPTSGGAKDDMKPKGTIAVATKSLLMYDPVNDRKGGNILEVNKVPVVPGSCGVQIKVQCGMLLEGYRPGSVVRFFPAAWKVLSLPREESFFGRE